MSDTPPTTPPVPPEREDVAADLASVPRLPRSGGFKLATADLVKIAFTAGILIMVVAIRRPCSDAVSNFVVDFDQGSGGSSARSQMPKPGNVDRPADDGSANPCEVTLGPNMSDAETRAAIARAQECAAARHGSGSGMGSGSFP